MIDCQSFAEIFNLVYPVNSLYLTVGLVDPNTIFGGTWEKLQGGYALVTTNATNGGDVSSANADNHLPGNAFQGGLPNIEGNLQFRGYLLNTSSCIVTTYGNAGAFSATCQTGDSWGNSIDYSSTDRQTDTVNFNAKRSSDSYGTYQTNKVSVVPDHIAVVVWKRTALSVGGGQPNLAHYLNILSLLYFLREVRYNA